MCRKLFAFLPVRLVLQNYYRIFLVRHSNFKAQKRGHNKNPDIKP
jgi:hypothetical protein